MRKVLMALALSLIGVGLSGVSVFAANPLNPICDDSSLSAEQREEAGCDVTTSVVDKVPDVLDAIFIIAGVLAVGMIIFGAVRIMISGGDPAKVKLGRMTIVYSVVGLIVVILAAAIVNFVLNSL